MIRLASRRSDGVIQVKKHLPSGTILIDRPAQRNALSRELIAQLSQALSDLHQEKRVRCVILAASGSVFSAGIDLAQWQQTSQEDSAPEQWHRDTEAIRELLDQMLRFPKPLLAAVDGPALGLGFGLVLACDLVVASPGASFGLPGSRLGLVSGLVAPLLAFRGGTATLTRMMLGAETLDAAAAHASGLVHHVVPSELVWARCQQWAERIAECPAETLQLSKRLINEMLDEQLSTNLYNGASVTATALTTEAAREGLNAFTEGRPPSYE
jgi:enoyl-CoA hydratase/carnithine racemase